jgi:hypothetical protein
MKKAFVIFLVTLFAVTTFGGVAFAKKVAKEPLNITVMPEADVALPPELAGKVEGVQRAAAAADTFVLFADNFDDGTLSPWTSDDYSAQIDTFFHVADASELDEGWLLPLNGTKSMWCGVDASQTFPYCGWETLPGYGNDWAQLLTSDPQGGDSVVVSYKIFYDSEAGYDAAYVEWSNDGGNNWQDFPIPDSLSEGPGAGYYDGIGQTPYITETYGDRLTGGNATVMVRFRFASDGAWSDEDGLRGSDGAVLLDDIHLTTRSGNSAPIYDATETFDGIPTGSEDAGIWTGTPVVAFGGPNPGHPAYGTNQFGYLYPGAAQLQEDICLFVPLFVVGFFDDPTFTNYACHTPDPRSDVGAMPYGHLDKGIGIYMDNEVTSPVFANSGYGAAYLLTFLVYRDLPLVNLQFYFWRVRSWRDWPGPDACPTGWRTFGFVYYGPNKDWLRHTVNPGALIDSAAPGLQFAVGAVDMCGVWQGIYGDCACHSHSPLLDEFEFKRIGISTPQWVPRDIDMFSDNFSTDETITGTAKADMTQDVLPTTSTGSIMPGDSLAITISPIGAISPGTGGPRAWCYVRVQRNGADPTGSSLGDVTTVRTAPMPSPGITRWPHVGTVDISGVLWDKFRMDQAFTPSGGLVTNRYCIDLNDNFYVPGDTVHYFIAADYDMTDNNGNEAYLTRTLNGQGSGFTAFGTEAGAAATPMEFTILPAGGYTRGGDILYVDDTDDRGGPAQLYWDTAFEQLGIKHLVDRFDVLGPSSAVDNSLASRAKNTAQQITAVYQKILWDSGNLTSGLLGDGTGSPEKSNDWGLVFEFLDQGAGKGLYLSGDDQAEEWSVLGGAGAVQVEAGFMRHNLINISHVNHGEQLAPLLTATGADFAPSQMVAYGGCAVINDFDVIAPEQTYSIIEFPYPLSGDGAVVSQATTNTEPPFDTDVVVLSGFSFIYIRDAGVQFPTARVQFLRDLLLKLGNVTGDPTGIKPAPQYAYALDPNYPNPFNPTTTIKYSIKERAHVSLKVYNVAGQLVKTLVDEVQSPEAIQPVTWNGSNDAGQAVSSGVYFYKLVTKNFSQTRKMVLLK